MTLFALSPEASDALTVWGFAVGVIGLIVGVAGFWIAIVQIRQTRKVAEAGQKAAEAAREASEKTLSESKDAYERFVGAFASRLLSELQRAVNSKDWRFAEIRAQDLAELLATLPDIEEPVSRIVLELRVFGQKFASRATEGEPRFALTKWNGLLNELNTCLDRIRAPFQRTARREDAADDDRTELPGTGGETPPPHAEGGGELGRGGAG
jgi:hypothetical protein